MGERKKLRAGHRPGHRASQLHEALVSAMQQETEAQHTLDERKALSKKGEEQLKDLKRQEMQLRQQLDEIRNNASS